MNIPKEEYFSKELDDTVKDFLEKYYTDDVPEKTGNGKCTIYHFKEFLNQEEFIKLTHKIYNEIIKTSILFDKKSCQDIFFKRIWINEIFKDCSGKIHKHGSDYEEESEKLDGVAIFYYKVPKNSSHFVVIDDESYRGSKSNVEDYSFHEKSNIKVKEGDLIIHDWGLLHGVSKHESEQSRICFIFNFKFA